MLSATASSSDQDQPRLVQPTIAALDQASLGPVLSSKLLGIFCAHGVSVGGCYPTSVVYGPRRWPAAMPTRVAAVLDWALMTSLQQLPDELMRLLDQLPHAPGVYLLKDRRQQVVYVGKARDLFKRVRSYFTRSSDDRPFVPRLARLLGDVETIVTRNEKEALLLENTLIKRHKPRFNVMLRDDKSYLVLRLDPTANYPRLEVTRRIGSDDARYFGPFHSASACRQTLRVVNRHFQLRTCTDRTMASRTRACLQYQIGRCPGPCVFEVDRDEYARQVEDVSLFLNGRQRELVASLRARMNDAVEQLNFENAAALRDQIAAIENSLQPQQTVGDPAIEQDVFGFYREGDAVDCAVLLFRSGKLVGNRVYSFSEQEFPDEDVLSSFISRYYENATQVPRQILLPFAIEDEQVKSQWLADLAGHAVSLQIPQRGAKRKLVSLAQANAKNSFFTRRRRHTDSDAALAKLQQRLRLTRLPRTIECYDVSGIHGQQVVASMVVMRQAELDRSAYRHFEFVDRAARGMILRRSMR